MKNPLRGIDLPVIAAWVVLSGCFNGKPTDDPDPIGPQWFPADVTGLPYAKAPEIIEVADGATLDLEAAPVKKVFRGHEVRMLAYNGSIPGPTYRVKQGAQITIRLRNRTGYPTSMHSHGIRMDYKFDGALGTSQDPIADKGAFTYRLRFPDAGVYWYHPHAREDWAMEMGLYGNFLVVPVDSTYWKPVDREEILMVDDLYLDAATWTAPFRIDDMTYTMMGRFGNQFMVNGDTNYHLTVKRKELVRFYVTNSSNARVFNIGFGKETGTTGFPKIKVVGTDNGKYERSLVMDREIVSPSERMIFETYFDTSGSFLLVSTPVKSAGFSFTPPRTVLGRITVLPDSVDTPYGASFALVDTNWQTIKSIDSVRSAWDSDTIPPDKRLFLTGIMHMMGPTSDGPANPLVKPTATPLVKSSAAQHDPGTVESKGIEFEDNDPLMAQMNKVSDRAMMDWYIQDVETGKKNHEIDWSFTTGSLVKIRIKNNGKSKANADTTVPVNSHVMPHPIHFHGQRFLVLRVNGRTNRNMAWKDTHLIGFDDAVDILLDASNPGKWMAHCHIAEHAQDDMMFHFTVK